MRRLFAVATILLCLWSLVGAPAQATPIQETLTISGAQFLSGGVDAETLGVVGTTLAVVETVPEPASLVLLGAGIAALGLVRRRRGVRLA